MKKVKIKRGILCFCFSFIFLFCFLPVSAAGEGSLIWVPENPDIIKGKEKIRIALIVNEDYGKAKIPPAALELLDGGRQEIEYLPVGGYEEALELVHTGQAELIVSGVEESSLRRADQTLFFRYIYRHPVGSMVLSIGIFSGLVVLLAGYVRIRVKRQSELRGYEKSYRMLADTVGQAGLEYDFKKDRLTVFGKRHEEVDIPETVEALHEKLKRRILRLVLTEDEFDEICRNAEPGKTYQAEFQCGLRGEGWNWFTLLYIIIFTEEPHPKPIRLLGCLMDAQQQHQTQERLQELGQYDKLTGTLNRTGAESRMTEALRNLEEYSQNVFLLMDVDWFKQINDNYGHLCGDDVLRVIGENINDIFQGDTIICRWGGDEFTMFVRGPGAGEELLKKRLEELRKRMKAYEYEGRRYPIGLSIGGVIPVEGMQMEEMFKQADDALYEVKKRGRDGYLIHEIHKPAQ